MSRHVMRLIERAIDRMLFKRFMLAGSIALLLAVILLQGGCTGPVASRALKTDALPGASQAPGPAPSAEAPREPAPSPEAVPAPDSAAEREPAPQPEPVPTLRLTGANRKDAPSTTGGKVVLAAGEIRVSYGSFGGRKSGPVGEDDARNLITLVESGRVLGDVLRSRRPLKFTGVSLDIEYDGDRSVFIHTTMDGETVEMTFMGLDWVNVPWCYVKAPEFVGRLHEIAGWRPYDIATLAGVRRITFENLQGSFDIEDAATVELLVAGLRQAEYCGPSKCPFDHTKLAFDCGDRVLHGILAGDGCPAIILEENEFKIDEETYKLLNCVVEERGFSIVPRRAD